MTIIFYIFIGLLAAKIIWNLTIPYDLAWRTWKAKDQKVGGISLMPYFEFVLLLLAIGAAALSNGHNWFQNPKQVIILGGLAIIISYVHLVVVSMIAGWIVARRKKGETNGEK